MANGETGWENQLKAAARKWEGLTLANDRMFGMVMEDNQICLALLQRIFPHLGIKRIRKAAVQKQVNTPLGVKVPRFDVYIRDEQHRTYILEMQVKNNHNLPFRIRYYMGQADRDILKPGDDYGKLRDFPVYVIFFCDFDYYSHDRPEYSFEQRCLSQLTMSAGAGQQMLVFNAKAKDFRDKIGLEGFLGLMHNQVKPGDQLAERISQKMKQIKQDPERRRLFMKYELDLMDARREGEAIGLKNGEVIGLKKGQDRQQEKDILLLVKVLKNKKFKDETIIQDLMNNYDLSPEKAAHYLEKRDQ